MTPFSGLSAFPVTPADDAGRVDTDRLQTFVSRLADAGVASIGVLGSTGGYPYFSTPERARALKAAVEAANGVPVLAGIGALRASDVTAHAQDAEAAGAAGLLLAPVSYLPLTDDEVLGLARDVAAVSTLPILIYNNPGTTHFNISEDLLLRLAEVRTVKAVKNPAPPDGDFADQIARLRPRLPDDFSLGYSADATIAGALSAGTDAWYSVIAGTFPDTCRDLWEARTDPDRLATLNARLGPLWDLFTAHGGIRVIHEAANLIGLGPVALPRPLLPLAEPVRAEIATALATAGLLSGEPA